MTFDSFGLPASVLSNIAKLGYTAPTPIQTQAVPFGMQGSDLMGLAQTGTGKTAAFLLPIITRLMKKPQVAGAPRRAYRRPRTLILAPTRELAEQIHDAALELGRNTGVRSTTVYGGVNMNRQINALRNGTDIVVACPGRLLDHMGQRTVDLAKIEVIVLDEADQMFDMGFLPDIKKILAALPKERQTMLFSATMPDAIRQLATDILREPKTVSVGHSAPAETVAHAIYPVAQHLKTKLLLEILQRNRQGSVLVFTRTKHRAKRLAEQLDKLGHRSTALQGNLSQNRRKEAMDGFRAGRFRVLVATDIAARGIDVSQITHVVNFDVPSTPETYTHRIGRTGRAARTGEAHTFVTAEDMSMVRAIERLLREPLARKTIEGFDYDERPTASAADRDFNRPILDRRGGRPGGQYGGQYGRSSEGRGSQYGRSSESRDGEGGGDRQGQRSERRPGNRFETRGDRRPAFGGAGAGIDREARGEARGEGRGEARGDSRREPRREQAARPYAERGQRQDQQGLFGRKQKYGALRSDNSDSQDAGLRPTQPGDDIYASDERPRRHHGGRPGGQGGQGGGPRQGRRDGEVRGTDRGQARDARGDSRRDGNRDGNRDESRGGRGPGGSGGGNDGGREARPQRREGAAQRPREARQADSGRSA